MSGWLAKTRVRAFDGRHGTVIGEPGLYRWPEVRWDDGEISLIDGAALCRAGDDWLVRAIASGERISSSNIAPACSPASGAVVAAAPGALAPVEPRHDQHESDQSRYASECDLCETDGHLHMHDCPNNPRRDTTDPVPS